MITKKFKMRIFIPVCLTMCVLAIVMYLSSREKAGYHPPPMIFKGDSSKLKETVIVPTLDIPIPKGKSAIWCEAFEIAWKKAQNNIFNGPIHIKNAESICNSLNDSKSSPDDLEPDSLYANAGFYKDNIISTIKNDMRVRFPNVNVAVDSAADGFLAYSYLSANVLFKLPFNENKKKLDFYDDSGKKISSIASFGIRSEDEFTCFNLRDQVEFLFKTSDSSGIGYDEFAIDPCRYTKPYQIVVALLHRQSSLGDYISHGRRLTEESILKKKENYFERNDVLLIPAMHWEIGHRFSELENELLNPGFNNQKVAKAFQKIRFKLDRCGAELKAEAKIVATPMPKCYIFNKPFLLYMKKRGSDRPFFVMWIENAELLVKK